MQQLPDSVPCRISLQILRCRHGQELAHIDYWNSYGANPGAVCSHWICRRLDNAVYQCSLLSLLHLLLSGHFCGPLVGQDHRYTIARYCRKNSRVWPLNRFVFQSVQRDSDVDGRNHPVHVSGSGRLAIWRSIMHCQRLVLPGGIHRWSDEGGCLGRVLVDFNQSRIATDSLKRSRLMTPICRLSSTMVAIEMTDASFDKQSVAELHELPVAETMSRQILPSSHRKWCNECTIS